MPFHSCASSLPYFSAHLINGSADIRTQQKDGWQFHRKNTAGWWSCVLRVQQSERSRQWEETTRPQREKKKTTTVSQAIFILLNHSHRFEVTGFIDSGEARWLQPIRAFHMGRNQRRKKKTACTHSHHQRASSAECTISLLVSSALATMS